MVVDRAFVAVVQDGNEIIFRRLTTIIQSICKLSVIAIGEEQFLAIREIKKHVLIVRKCFAKRVCKNFKDCFEIQFPVGITRNNAVSKN